MAKVPTIYDIGNFSLDWNNVSTISSSGFGRATKDGILHLVAADISGTTTPERAIGIVVAQEIPSNATDQEISDFMISAQTKCLSCSGYSDSNTYANLYIPVHKGECFYFYEPGTVDVRKREFIPFVYPAVEPTPGCVSYVIETGHNADNTAFYRKYSDGYIEQWGEIAITDSDASYYTINFPISFTTTKYMVFASESFVGESLGAIPYAMFRFSSRTVSSFTFKTSGTSNSNGTVLWKATGY